MDVKYDGNQFLKDSQFAIFFQNFSNRTFVILGYQITNGNALVASLPGNEISDGSLIGGEYGGVIYTLPEPINDNDIKAHLFLADIATGVSFNLTASYPYSPQ